VTPQKSLPTEYRTPRSNRIPLSSSQSKFVSVDTVNSILEGKYSDKHTAIVDCRFAYEFSAGHIHGAKNYPPGEVQSLIQHVFGANGLLTQKPTKLLLIMHCEFSQCRAPRMAAELIRYSTLSGKSRQIEVYVMKGGYSEFYRVFPDSCDPKGYLQM
jgi:M-phase inducer tyrosine phosphatase